MRSGWRKWRVVRRFRLLRLLRRNRQNRQHKKRLVKQVTSKRKQAQGRFLDKG